MFPVDEYILANGPFESVQSTIDCKIWYVRSTRRTLGIGKLVVDAFNKEERSKDLAERLNLRLALLYMVRGTPAESLV